MGAPGTPAAGALHASVQVRLGRLDLAVDLHVAPGEVVGVLGPNGAGKSTLLAALAGLVRLDGGRVALGGRVLEEPARGVCVVTEERGVGLVFQQHLLFPHLTALENVAFGPRAKGLRPGPARRQAREWLERVDLGAYAGHRPDALSGGQSQRVALARTLAAAPGLLLLDEPLSALDVEARRAVRSVLRAHLEAFAGPALLVTHEPLEAVALADRLVVLEGGRVTQEGTVRKVTEHPRSDWVAGLVGLNLYRGVGRGGEVRLDDGARLAGVGVPDGEVLAAVHPREVALSRARPRETSARNVWSGSVKGLDVRGDAVRVVVGGPVPVVAEVTSAAVAALDLAGGGEVWVAIKATAVRVYQR